MTFSSPNIDPIVVRFPLDCFPGRSDGCHEQPRSGEQMITDTIENCAPAYAKCNNFAKAVKKRRASFSPWLAKVPRDLVSAFHGLFQLREVFLHGPMRSTLCNCALDGREQFFEGVDVRAIEIDYPQFGILPVRRR